MYSPMKWGTLYWTFLFFFKMEIKKEMFYYIAYLIPCDECRDNALKILKKVDKLDYSSTFIEAIEKEITTKIHSKASCSAPKDYEFDKESQVYSKQKKYNTLAETFNQKAVLKDFDNIVSCKYNKEMAKKRNIKNVQQGLKVIYGLLYKKKLSCPLIKKIVLEKQ